MAEDPIEMIFCGPGCWYCNAQSTGDRYVSTEDAPRQVRDILAESGSVQNFVCVMVCAEHGGPLAPQPRLTPRHARLVERRIRRQLHRRGDWHLDDLIQSYAKEGFSYGRDADGFLKWGHAKRILTNIPSRSGAPDA